MEFRKARDRPSINQSLKALHSLAWNSASGLNRIDIFLFGIFTLVETAIGECSLIDGLFGILQFQISVYPPPPQASASGFIFKWEVFGNCSERRGWGSQASRNPPTAVNYFYQYLGILPKQTVALAKPQSNIQPRSIRYDISFNRTHTSLDQYPKPTLTSQHPEANKQDKNNLQSLTYQ